MNTDQNQQDLGQNQVGSEPIPPSSPMVAVSGGGGSVPPWFYFIFGLTVVAFFLVTGFLVFSFFSKQAISPSPSPSFSPPPTIVSPQNSTPVSSPIPTPTLVNSYLDSLKNVSESDSLDAIERDVVLTDVTMVEQEMKSLDSELDFTPGN